MAISIATAPQIDVQIQTDVLAELKWEPRVQPAVREDILPSKEIQRLARHRKIGTGSSDLFETCGLNIRLSSKDLEAIQKRALAEGLPYQTLIASQPAAQVRRDSTSPKITRPIGSKLALVNHFKRVAIWIEHVRGVITRIIFQTSTRRNIVLCARRNGSLVEGVHRFIVFCVEAPVD
jgi:hypothetical protein